MSDRFYLLTAYCLLLTASRSQLHRINCEQSCPFSWSAFVPAVEILKIRRRLSRHDDVRQSRVRRAFAREKRDVLTVAEPFASHIIQGNRLFAGNQTGNKTLDAEQRDHNRET